MICKKEIWGRLSLQGIRHNYVTFVIILCISVLLKPNMEKYLNKISKKGNYKKSITSPTWYLSFYEKVWHSIANDAIIISNTLFCRAFALPLFASFLIWSIFKIFLYFISSENIPTQSPFIQNEYFITKISKDNLFTWCCESKISRESKRKKTRREESQKIKKYIKSYQKWCIKLSTYIYSSPGYKNKLTESKK